jgi:predicted nucleotidyltransferase
MARFEATITETILEMEAPVAPHEPTPEVRSVYWSGDAAGPRCREGGSVRRLGREVWPRQAARPSARQDNDTRRLATGQGARKRPCTLLSVNSLAVEEMIEHAGRTLIGAASAPAKVILVGSHARGDADEGSDLDFLVIEHGVKDRLAEEVRLRRALRGFGAPVDVIVMDEALVKRRAKVKGTMVDHALREGRVVAES